MSWNAVWFGIAYGLSRLIEKPASPLTEALRRSFLVPQAIKSRVGNASVGVLLGLVERIAR